MAEYFIRPHEKAPLFPNQTEGERIIKDLFSDRMGSHPERPDKIIDYLRQAGYVNLYFFLRFIAGATGPYQFLNEGVHLDICNFRQSDDCMEPGSTVAIFLARGFAKTTICTTGASGWELLRDPNNRIQIGNATALQAQRFMLTTQRIFDGTNSLVNLLYPEYVLNEKDNTQLKLIMPNAKTRYNEPNVSCTSVDGRPAGGHYDILQYDDLVGIENVDANYVANVSMENIKTWIDINIETLLVSPMSSRKFIVGTRYGPGDAYEGIWNDAKRFVGYQVPTMKPRADGTWTIYYRHVIEDGIAINPYVMTVEKYAKLQKEKPLVAAYQYANDTTVNLTNEFARYETKTFVKVKDVTNDEWGVQFQNETGDTEIVWLAHCSTAITVDWAGSDKMRSSNTSRSSIGFWAKDSKQRMFRVDQAVGYFGIIDVFNSIYMLCKRWRGYVNAVVVEPNAMQLAVADLIESEKRFSEMGVYFERRPAKGNKIVRIRATVGPVLAQGLIYLNQHTSIEFTEEKMAFGPSSNKLDVLDETEKAISYLVAPENEEEERYRKRKLDDERVMEYATSDTDEGVSAFPYS